MMSNKINVPFSPPDIKEEEIQEVARALRSGWITTGPRTKEFEKQIAEYVGTKRAVCLNSATACMEMVLRAMGIGAGDEVITTAYTYTATCSAICHTGAVPILVDTLPDSYEMDPQKVREAVTERTKAVICVDLAGIVYSKYDEIFKIAEEKRALFHAGCERQKKLGRILVMADAAHAFGASHEHKMCGQIADFTCYSFHAVKNLTTAEGGALVWSEQIEQAGIDGEELYKEFMGDMSEEIERENKIINDLLSLVKMDKTANTMNIKSENMNELIEKILKRLRPIAATRNIELVYESFRPVTTEVDEMKISLAISNLVENAIKYNKENGWVHVSLNADHKNCYIEVADSGIGIPAEAQEHIFERFYRVDKSHSREIGGTGLGLAIARSAVVMHRGAIKVFSQPSEGTTFTVRIPLNYVS